MRSHSPGLQRLAAIPRDQPAIRRRQPVGVLDDRRRRAERDAAALVAQDWDARHRPDPRELAAALLALDDPRLELEFELVQRDRGLPAERRERVLVQDEPW